MATKMNQYNKALKSFLAKEKRFDSQALLEYEVAFQNNSERGKVYDQYIINELYGRDDWSAARGATKTTHRKSHEGKSFKYIVVKRHQTGGYMPECRNKWATGNQLIDEINCWVMFYDKPEADLLCPILKYYTSKSDKVSATSETMQRNVVIVAQRAVETGNAKSMCRLAYEMNREKGYRAERPESRYAKLETLSQSQNWRDVLYNPGNCGVVFDYSQNRYKAVIIDYALQGMVGIRYRRGRGNPPPNQLTNFEQFWRANMNINFKLKADLLERGFSVANENTMRMEYANGSIAHYTKCAITLGHRTWGDMANQWFYWVRFESFAESGQPEIDHHTITECYVAETKIADFLKSKGILSEAERAERRAEFKKRMRG